MTGLIAPIVEAYGELRVNKGRIMLALIGVALSVFILTAVMGAGGMLGSALEQSVEKSAGRASVVGVNHMGGGDPELTADERDEIVLEQIDRLGNEVKWGIPGGFTVFGSPDVLVRDVSVAGK